MDISLREFQRNASKYLGKLPVNLTVYDKIVATVVDTTSSRQSEVTKNYVRELEQEIEQLKALKNKSVDTSQEDGWEDSPASVRCEWARTKCYGWAEGEPVKLKVWNQQLGEAETIKAHLCPKHQKMVAKENESYG